MKRKLTVVLLCVLVAALAGGGALVWRANVYRSDDRVLPNVTCAGADLSGMTYDQAAEAIQAAVARRQYYVDLTLPDGETCRVLPEQTVTEAEPGTALELAWGYGREDDSFFGPMLAHRRAERSAMEVPVDDALTCSAASVREQVEAFGERVYRAPTDSAGEIDQTAHTAVLQPGRTGRTIDVEAVTALTLDALDRRQDQLSIDYTVIDLDRAQLSALVEDLAAEAASDPVQPEIAYDEASETSLLQVGEPGYALDTDQAEAVALAGADGPAVTVPLTAIPPESYDLTAFHDWLQRDPQENYYYIDGTLYGGTPGYDFDLTSAEAAVQAANYGDTVAIPLTVTQPQLSADYAQWWLFRDRLGSSDTYHTADSNRTTNLRLACQALDGTVINPGQEFSFNGIVGERTAAKGYKTGIVYINSGSEPQLGGGICQVATGCYQAALKAGMVITERHEHMYPVTYCAGGLDATIYWGSLDFKFRNPWNMPVRLNASVSGGQVHISIDGSNFTGHYILLSSSRVGASAGHSAYRAYRTVYNPDGSVYYREDLGVSTYENH